MTVEAVKAGNETLLSQIIRLVEEAQSTKPPVQKIVDRITGVFVPVVFALSALTFIIWMLAGSPATAIVTSISVLIIACPCALGLATPTALISGLGRGAAEGILIRNAAVLETAGNVDTILLDKTGTITKGKPSVKEIVWSEAADASDRSMLATMETASNIPWQRCR
jgi:Cu2+-exporting ATPase